MRIHRLTVDAYAVQHPGGGDPQSVQSVAIHLMSLCAFFEMGMGAAGAARLSKMAAERKGAYERLERPRSLGRLTVKDVHPARNAEEHVSRVRSWAQSAWAAWSAEHDRIRAWLAELPAP